MASGNSQINKPQCGCPKRAKLPDININTGVQSINTEILYGRQLGFFPCQTAVKTENRPHGQTREAGG